MMVKIFKSFQFLLMPLGLLAMPLLATAQSADYDRSSNPNSVRPIERYEIMWKKSLWFSMDMRRKTNEPYYAKGNEFAKLLIEAVKEDRVQPFYSDSLETRMSKEEFLSRLRIPQTEDDDLAAGEDFLSQGTGVQGGQAGEERHPRQFYLMELKVDRVFDKRRSRMYNDIQAITILLPAEFSRKKVNEPIGTFSFKELHEQVFNARNEQGQLVANPKAIWFNPRNAAQHRNLSDAFTLELYDGQLMRYENPRNSSIVDMYGDGRKGFMKSMEELYKMLEYEATLWSN